MDSELAPFLSDDFLNSPIPTRYYVSRASGVEPPCDGAEPTDETPLQWVIDLRLVDFYRFLRDHKCVIVTLFPDSDAPVTPQKWPHLMIYDTWIE